jgi:uncharacterized cupin superfamily protein
MDPYTAKPIDEMTAINGGITILAGAELGVEAFGMQVFDFPPDFPDYPEHDHGEEGMEEVYLVLEGSAEFEVDGDRVALERGGMISIAPATRRKLLPGPQGVRILALGGVPGETYERPTGLDLPAA